MSQFLVGADIFAGGFLAARSSDSVQESGTFTGDGCTHGHGDLVQVIVEVGSEATSVSLQEVCGESAVNFGW